MKMFIVGVLLIASSAFASSRAYDLSMQISLNDKLVASPQVFVKEGETATVTQQNGREVSLIEVVATEGKVQNIKGILLKFNVGIIRKGGQKTIFSRPQLLVKENESAHFTVEAKDTTEKMSLTVVAKRNQL